MSFKEPEKPRPVAPASAKLYRVHVGVFSVKENAEKMQARLKAAGFNSFVLPKKQITAS